MRIFAAAAGVAMMGAVIVAPIASADTTSAVPSATGTTGPVAQGTCTTQGCGGEVTNHSPFYIRIANNWCSGSSADVAGDHLSCVAHWDNYDAWPADAWLRPNEYSGRYPKYYDTDAFQAVDGCTTTFNRWAGPLLLGRWEYDRHGKGSVWIKVPDWQFVDILNITC